MAGFCCPFGSLYISVVLRIYPLAHLSILSFNSIKSVHNISSTLVPMVLFDINKSTSQSGATDPPHAHHPKRTYPTDLGLTPTVQCIYSASRSPPLLRRNLVASQTDLFPCPFLTQIQLTNSPQLKNHTSNLRPLPNHLIQHTTPKHTSLTSWAFSYPSPLPSLFSGSS
jgi:hypothetical protein